MVQEMIPRNDRWNYMKFKILYSKLNEHHSEKTVYRIGGGRRGNFDNYISNERLVK